MRARKGWAAMAAVLCAVAVQAASLSVTDVKIAQRYPWNGLVDITYTVNCDDPNKDVWVYPVGYDADKATSVALIPQYLSGQGASNAVHKGVNRMTWDMAKQMGKDYNRAAFSVTLHAYCDAAPYMVIDLSKGPTAEKYDISHLAEIPEGGWTDEYKTTKMVFRLILPGETGLGATLTKPYYFGVFPITKQQWLLVTGETFAYNENPGEWKNRINYDMLRGELLGSEWPKHQQVDATSFVGKMRLRTGITIDLPTIAQWWCAATAGGQHTDIVNPNVWGIYGLYEIGEWNLDWYWNTHNWDPWYYSAYRDGEYKMTLDNSVASAFEGKIDPVGPESNIDNARTISGWGFQYNVSGAYGVGRLTSEGYVHQLSTTGAFKSGITSNTLPEINGRGGSVYEAPLLHIGARLVALPACK